MMYPTPTIEEATRLLENLGISPEADLRWALSFLKDRPTFTLHYCQTMEGNLFWQGWDAYTDWVLRHEDPEGKLVPMWLKRSPGFAGLMTQRREHKKRHSCINPDKVCKRCDCLCAYHTIDGPCFCRHDLMSFNYPDPMRLPDGSPAPKKVLGYLFCNCEGFI